MYLSGNESYKKFALIEVETGLQSGKFGTFPPYSQIRAYHLNDCI